jgi:TPR repeat protein
MYPSLTFFITIGRTGEDIYQKAHKLYNEKNYASALPLFLEIAEFNNSLAQLYLGFMYENGFGVDQNYKTALSWYTKSGNNGIAAGLYNAGMT